MYEIMVYILGFSLILGSVLAPAIALILYLSIRFGKFFFQTHGNNKRHLQSQNSFVKMPSVLHLLLIGYIPILVVVSLYFFYIAIMSRPLISFGPIVILNFVLGFLSFIASLKVIAGLNEKEIFNVVIIFFVISVSCILVVVLLFLLLLGLAGP